MLKIGQINTLRIQKSVDFGVYLDAGDDLEILLPSREVPDDWDIDDQIEVFICYDSEDRLIATTKKPLGTIGEFVLLEVVAVERVGAFLDWGLPKDLFLPYAEQSRPLKVGQKVIVYIYLDKSSRISASMRLERNVEKSPNSLKVDQAVDLLIIGETDLGFKAIIDGKFLGVLFRNEIFQKLEYGKSIKGFIKRVREDGKIDLTLQKPGQNPVLETADQIMKQLHEKGGFLEVHDKTSAETIYQLFGVSKKKFKIALGGLYKKRLLQVEANGIRLTTKNEFSKALI